MSMLKQCVPPELLRITKHMLGYGSHFRGHYASWKEAEKHTAGYDSDAILQRVLAATLSVRNGHAAFERDGVLFDRPQDPYPLLSGLLRAAALNHGHLRVLDFGGALGSSYFQCHPWLEKLHSLLWCVVEQPHFVETGNAQVSNDQLIFSPSIEAACTHEFDAVLFSGVLQYLESPMEIMRIAAALKPRFIIIDRTPVVAGGSDTIRIQRQSATRGLVPSSYPVRLFAEKNLLAISGHGYKLLSRFDALDAPMGGLQRVDFKGFIFEREA